MINTKIMKLDLKNVLYYNGLSGVVVELDSGLFALVDYENKSAVLSEYIWEFLKWGAFKEVPTEILNNKVKEILFEEVECYIPDYLNVNNY